ncbi:MAG: TVP38/TMEM64 family protein [Nitrospirae bacterium]|nr:TVP38/TMEM64 family protein [Nitrospirota bacterium]
MSIRGPRALKALFLFILIGVIALFWAYGAGDYLTFANLKALQGNLAHLFQKQPATVIFVFMALYILIAALSLPGAEILSIAGGAVFGLFAGTVVVSFASTIGALLGCIVVRYFLKDWVEAVFQKRVAAINSALEKNGPYYLFILRLVPLFPFFLVNMAAGLTRMPLFTFYWVSQLGMLPVSFIFVNAGSRLQSMNSSDDILSPGVILSFGLLALFPLAAKAIYGRFIEK